MDNLEIGIATIFYNEDGSFLSGKFEPKLTSLVDAKAMSFMDKIDCDTEEDRIKNQATNIFASWFEQMNKIELIDLTQYKIDSVITGECLRYTNGNIARISLLFKIVKL